MWGSKHSSLMQAQKVSCQGPTLNVTQGSRCLEPWSHLRHHSTAQHAAIKIAVRDVKLVLCRDWVMACTICWSRGQQPQPVEAWVRGILAPSHHPPSSRPAHCGLASMWRLLAPQAATSSTASGLAIQLRSAIHQGHHWPHSNRFARQWWKTSCGLKSLGHQNQRRLYSD